MASHGVSKSARIKTDQQREAEQEKIQKYQTLEQQFRQLVDTGKYDEDVFQLTTKLLRINPEYYTVWNARRRCLLSGASSKSLIPPMGCGIGSAPPEDHSRDHLLDTVQSELMFTVPLLMEHPKCYWIWNYRMWMLEKANYLLSNEAANRVWLEELGLISKMLGKDERNYHAWAYRRYVVAQLESPKFGGNSMVESEFEYTKQKLLSNFSNFSAWHNRSELLGPVVALRGLDADARSEFLDQEFEFIDEAVNLTPEDQSLWYYHQYLISNLTATDASKTIVPDLDVSKRVAAIQREIEFIKDLLDDYEDINWIYVSLLEYSLAICRLENQSPKENMSNLPEWLSKIRSLDKLQAGRWEELASELQIAS